MEAVALYNYEPTKEGRLSIKKFDRITNVKKVNDDWCKGELRGNWGLFPANRVHLYSASVPPLPPSPNEDNPKECKPAGEGMCIGEYNTGVALLKDTTEQIDVSDIRIDDVIESDGSDSTFNRGGCSMVFTAMWRGQKVAVRKEWRNIENHSLQLHSLCHPNLITYYGSVTAELAKWTVMELVPGGTLYDRLHKQHYKPSYEESLKWSIEIASALDYLHHQGIVHRNIKSRKVFMTNKLSAKLAIDNEYSALADNPQGECAASTFRWMAPELISDHHIDVQDLNLKAADVYSYAMLLYELWVHKLPYEDRRGHMVLLAVMQGQRPATPTRCPEFITDLMQKCWSPNPEERPQISTVLHSLQMLPPTHPQC